MKSIAQFTVTAFRGESTWEKYYIVGNGNIYITTDYRILGEEFRTTSIFGLPAILVLRLPTVSSNG